MDKEQNTKQTILDCALDLFSSKGYDAVGVAELVSAANITKPTLYYYFGSKEGVFRAILGEYYELLNSSLKEAAIYEPNPDEYEKDIYPVLVKIAESYFDFAKKHTKFYLMVMSLNFSPKSAVATEFARPYFTEQFHIVEQLVEEISKVHGNLQNKEKQLAQYYIALVNANIAGWIYEYGKLDGMAAGQMVKQFMHGIFA